MKRTFFLLIFAFVATYLQAQDSIRVTLAELFLINRRYVSYDGKYVLRLPNSVQGLGK